MVVLVAGTIIHPFIFAPVFGTILVLSLIEFYKITEKASFSPQKKFGIILGSVLFVLSFLVAYNIVMPNLIILIIPLLFLVFIAELFRKKSTCLRDIAITLTGIIYVALPFSLLNFIVLASSSNATGYYPWILIGIFMILWVNDSMAYVSGSLLGRHKIAANISPGKSWEGLIGGAIFAVIMGIVNAVLFQEIDILNWIVIAFIIVVFGTMGDFFESKLKREIEIKDSGNIMPGHGGFLDRFDSLLFAIPVIFVWLNLIDKF